MNDTIPHRSTILVTHRDPLLRAGLVAALRQHAAFEILVDDIDTLRSDEPRVDVIIADYSDAMRLSDPAVRAARQPLAAARIMALTSYDGEADIRRAIEGGIHGYLLLGGPLSELIEGVTTVACGLRYLGRSVSQRMADSLTRTLLTSRETEVLQLVTTGQSNKAIARQLNIELATVKSHMTAIMTKLNVTSRTQAAGVAATRGLVADCVLVRPAPIASRIGLIASRMQLA